MRYVVLIGIVVLGLVALSYLVERFIGYFMPNTAGMIDAAREARFISKKVRALLDGESYTTRGLRQYVESHSPKPLRRRPDYGTMEGHPEVLEFERNADAARFDRIVSWIITITQEVLARRNATLL